MSGIFRNLSLFFQGRMATLSDETCFGDLFKRFAPFLKMYVEYCTQHENTASRISLIAAKNDKFSNLLHVSGAFRGGYLLLSRASTLAENAIPRKPRSLGVCRRPAAIPS